MEPRQEDEEVHQDPRLPKLGAAPMADDGLHLDPQLPEIGAFPMEVFVQEDEGLHPNAHLPKLGLGASSMVGFGNLPKLGLGASSMVRFGNDDEELRPDPHLPELGASPVAVFGQEDEHPNTILPKLGASPIVEFAKEDEQLRPDPYLPKLGAASMADVDRHCRNHDPSTVQIDIDRSTRLVDAVAIFQRTQPGVRAKGQEQIQVFNPERLVRKVEAEAAMRTAVVRMEKSIGRMDVKIERTRGKARQLESLLQLGASNVAVGPSINQRAMEQHQVTYPTHAGMPDDAVGPERRISKKQKLKSRKSDAESQITFWQLNLVALREKESAQVEFRDALVASKDKFTRAALVLPTFIGTFIGSGYSDLTFDY